MLVHGELLLGLEVKIKRALQKLWIWGTSWIEIRRRIGTIFRLALNVQWVLPSGSTMPRTRNYRWTLKHCQVRQITILVGYHGTEYFTARIGADWIIQELILASELVLRCVNVQMDWEAVSYIFAQGQGPRARSPEEPNGEPVRPSCRLKLPQQTRQNLGKCVPSAHSGVPYRIHQRRSGKYGHEPSSFTTLFHQFVSYREAKCADVRE
jgi:hypothetical protein